MFENNISNMTNMNQTEEPYTEEPYTEEDVDQYIEYADILYQKVTKRFFPKVEIERRTDDMMEKYFEKFTGLLTSSAPAIDRVYANMLEPFGYWLKHDCALTNHKGKPPVKAPAFNR